jgi:hypothetical protein
MWKGRLFSGAALICCAATATRKSANIFVSTMKVIAATLDQNMKAIVLAAALVFVTAIVQRRTTRRVRYTVERIDSTVRRVDEILRNERNR